MYEPRHPQPTSHGLVPTFLPRLSPGTTAGRNPRGITLRQQKMALDTPSAARRQNDKAVSCQPPKYSWFQQSAAQLRCGAGEEVLPSHFRLFLITFTHLRY